MTSDLPLDYAVFQLSPRRSHCELFVSYDGATEKLASGLVKPFVTHLKVAEEQVALAVKSIKLEVERYKNADTWFTKGTLERFVRFVSTPEVLEIVNTFDAEMSQLEAARRIYSQGAEDDQFTGGDGTGGTGASDATKKELLRAIDVRLGAVRQDLSTACSRAFTAGFCPDSVSQLQLFADRFGAPRLSEACSKFIDLSGRRPDLFNQQPWKSKSDDDEIQSKPSTCQPPTKPTFPLRRFSREPSPNPNPNPSEDMEERENPKDKDQVLGPTTTPSATNESETSSTQSNETPQPQLTRRLSVQERINLFESKQKVNSPASSIPTPTSVSSKPDLRRLSSDVSAASDKAVLRRWSGASDMSVDVSGERKDVDSNANTPTPTSSSSSLFPPKSKDNPNLNPEEGYDKFKDFSNESKSPLEELPARKADLKDQNPSIVGFKSKAGSSGRVADFESGEVAEEKPKAPLVGLQGEVETKLDVREVQKKTTDELESAAVESESVVENEEIEIDSTPQPKWGSFGGQTRKVGKKDFEVFENQAESISVQMESLGSSRSKFQGHDSSSERARKSGGRSEDGASRPGKGTLETREPFSSSSGDQVQRVRQAKANQGAHDDLKMKADELEKLFAEHKLRAPSEQSNPARRSRPAETLKEQDGSSVYRKPGLGSSPRLVTKPEPASGSSGSERFNSTPLMKTVDSQDYDVTPKHNTYTSSFSDNCRGSSYHKYMQKRDAKLREEWSCRRTEKEAKMKAIQVSLEKNRAEIKSKLAGSAEKRNSISGTHRRAEKLRLFNARSAMKRGQAIDSFMSDGDEDQAEFFDSSRSGQSEKVLPNKSTASTPRVSTSLIPRSSGKVSNTAAERRRLNSNNPLANSVPNFSDLRKENTKPLGSGSKAVRPLARNHARKKSVSDDSPLTNEDKPRWSQTSRKNTANAFELNDSGNSDDCKEEDVEPKSFLRKGTSGIVRSNASMLADTLGNGHAFNDVRFETEDMIEVPKEEEEDFEFRIGESANPDNGKGRLSPGSDKSANSGYEDSDAFRFSELAPTSASEFPTSMTSLFRAMGSLQDSPGASPGSWNSRINNPFSFTHEISNLDVADSPMGSPASWSYQNLTQSEAEAARMRKKWGAAQKPIVGTESSHSLSRKDVTKGLKRFLKFGRKNRASESMADWISATTSEGDDDTEDGRDFTFRSSEDLRKSRMGFSHSHHSDDGFTESDMFNEQVQALQSSIPTPPANFKLREEHLSGSSLKAPKSFFSLSNFRSKGGDSKLR